MKRKLLYVSKSIFLMLLLFAALPAYSAKIYFKNTLGWDNVYVYTYSSDYWSDTNGSGSNGIQSGPNPMTLVSGTSDIYEYEVVDKTFTIVSFTKDKQENYNNFNNTAACYRSDYKEATPMFTPDKTQSKTINETTYYNEGNWSAYTTGTTYTPVLDNANEISCFYEVNSKDYSFIYVWNGDTNYAGGFPGTKMDPVGTTAAGKTIYKWKYEGPETTVPANVIFSVGNSSNQTSNLVFTNHGYYIDDRLDRTITAIAETKYSVNISTGEGGIVNPSGEQQVGSTAFNINATANTGYTFSNWTTTGGVSVTDANAASTTITATAAGSVTANFTATSSATIYYVVFPDANVGNTERADKTAPKIPTGHTAFRLIPSRNRNAKDLDNDLVSINLKIDGAKGQQLRYDTNDEIKFYIIDNNGNYFKSSKTVSNGKDYLHAFKTEQLGQTANNGVDCYDTRDGSITSTTAPGYYNTIHKDDAKDTKSLTFMFSKNNSKSKSYIINSKDDPTTKNEPSNSVDGFGTTAGMKSGNLIVGFLTSRGPGSDYYTNHISNGVYLVGQMDGNSYTHNENYEMKKILYPLDVTDDAQADSIVYSCTVKKGSANWDDFFLSFSTGDMVEDNTKPLWNRLLRPSVQNQMDGQALEGGVTFFKDNDGEDNTQQALNPLLSNEQKQRYVSYTIYFNATYSTYRIEFHDGFYIAGEAVEESGSYDPANRIAMSSAELNGKQHYIYTGKFLKGQPFAFFLNEDSYTLNYCEDEHTVSEPLESATAWDVQAPEGGADYAFYNRVQYNTTGSNANKDLGTGKNGMVWGLPTGTYTIRFYNHAEKENNNQLYTVDKEVLMANATSSYKNNVTDATETEHNNGGWRTFSDDCALLLPNGVKAYYAAQVQSGKVYLKELTDGYIPAHCPVIISNPNLLDGTKSIAFPVRPEGYDVKLADGETNYLVDCYKESGTVSPVVTDDGKTKYNYFFAHIYKFYGSKVMSGVPLGFWKTFNNATTKKNYTYLSVDTELNPSKYEQNIFIYDENETVESTKAYCFVMAFDEDELGDNTTTGIEQVKDNAEVDMTNAVWYNMQGVRITKPSAPGMYICNGKKVVVR